MLDANDEIICPKLSPTELLSVYLHKTLFLWKIMQMRGREENWLDSFSLVLPCAQADSEM